MPPVVYTREVDSCTDWLDGGGKFVGLTRIIFFPYNVIINFSFSLQKPLLHCMSVYSQFMANKC